MENVRIKLFFKTTLLIYNYLTSFQKNEMFISLWIGAKHFCCSKILKALHCHFPRFLFSHGKYLNI